MRWVRRRRGESEIEALRTEVRDLRTQVRRLRGRDRPDLGYLFVVTYGRSGSTLLTGVLNSIPGFVVRGENRGAVYHLFEFHRTMLRESKRASRKTLRQRTHSFFGIGDFPPQQSLAGLRRLLLDTVLRPTPETRVTGFKEIRWAQPDLAEYVAWLREVFPGARFVVNTRDHADVAKSKWWGEHDPDDVAHRLAEIERRILEVADGLGEAAYRVHYDDYVADPTVLRGLFDWLGEPWDEEAVRETLAVRHSF
ncbi:sulfotransferase [Nocardioides sp. cx-173]|uniref:sulfotransferase n=1 Tax=Nocardioides sp. cx-173 TaxID=2898796 RepID=UPI001E4533A9|nr:sulfotransferase [Nocardioides sp. cx-173]MCD4523842.1 sulfotransferase [Nocardioides sp. cx-173]UGB41838.1 sulfotransferase [Nocardioides sp. cx-173]